jgi:hypothetical protein
VACAICETRKEKRFCPAVHGRICPICCGTEREVTLDCPSNCAYLQQARRNERQRSVEEIGREALFPKVHLPENVTELRESLIVALGYAMVQAGQRDRSLLDRDLVAVLTGLAKTYETRADSGLWYESPMSNPIHNGLASELRRTIAEYQAAEKKQYGYSTATDSDILRALVFLVRSALAYNGRPRSRAFLDALEKNYSQPEPALFTPQDPGSRLIIP